MYREWEMNEASGTSSDIDQVVKPDFSQMILALGYIKIKKERFMYLYSRIESNAYSQKHRTQAFATFIPY